MPFFGMSGTPSPTNVVFYGYGISVLIKKICRAAYERRYSAYSSVTFTVKSALTP